MAKIGNYNIPEITLDKCINVCNIINSTKDRSMSRLELSMLINMSARGGQYSKLINSCKSWGLIDGREYYTVTQLGIKVLNPANSNELIISKKELILSNAGHEPPLIYSNDKFFSKFEDAGPPLGIAPKVKFTEKKIL